MKRRLLSAFMAFCMICCISFSVAPKAKAANTTISASDIVSTARSLCGKYKYKSAGYSPSHNGFDCTGFIYYVYHTCLGYDMTLGQARNGSSLSKLGTKITNKDDFQPGDILESPSHAAIYVGNDMMIDCGSSKGVSERSVSKATWFQVQYAIRLSNVTQDGTSSSGSISSSVSSPPSSSLNVTSTENGSWDITIPANYKLLLYSGNTSTSSATYCSARTSSYTVYCSQKITLSNGVIRYYGAFNSADHYWLTYTNGMTVKDNNTAKSHTVNFNANGGSVSMNNKIVTAGDTYGSLPIPTRDGYSFDGWYTARNGGTEITSSTTVNLTSDQITLYAHWSNKYTTVILDPNGGTLHAVSTTFKTQFLGNSYSLGNDIPTKSGYTFDGWYTAKSGGTKVEIVYIGNNCTLYAHWAQNSSSFVVTLDPANGQTAQTITVHNRGTYEALDDVFPHGEWGWEFDGWYTAKKGGTRITSSTPIIVNADHTLYAHWTQVLYTISLNPNGGAFMKHYTNAYGEKTTYFSDEPNDYIIESHSETYGENLPIPVRNGYTFDGWYTSPSGGTLVTAESSLAVRGNHTLYAHWH